MEGEACPSLPESDSGFATTVDHRLPLHPRALTPSPVQALPPIPFALFPPSTPTPLPLPLPFQRVFRLSLLGFTAYVTADPEALRPLLADEGGHFTIPVQTFTALMGAYNLQAHKEVHAAWVRGLRGQRGGWAGPGWLGGSKGWVGGRRGQGWGGRHRLGGTEARVCVCARLRGGDAEHKRATAAAAV